MSIVRDNLMKRKGYTPYCGNNGIGCKRSPRTVFNGKQFECKDCGWKSEFPTEFINEYTAKWDLRG